MVRPARRQRRWAALAAVALLSPLVALGAVAAPAQAKGGDTCDGGGFSLVNTATSAVVARGDVQQTVQPAALGATSFGVRGRYVTFDVRLSDFAVLDYALTGAASPQDLTGGRRTPVFASKTPDHRGLALSGAVTVSIGEDGLALTRRGAGLSMKIQAKDCAQGGIFQMEPQRADAGVTRITHTLADPADPALTPFYFDNPAFRSRVGQFLGAGCTSITTGPAGQYCVQVTARTNIGNGLSPAFVARDSAQLATRVPQADCTTATPLPSSLQHCGGVSVWDVASGGRMGFVSGGDAVEVANPPTLCTHQCRGHNQVQGQLASLGAPFPVPTENRLEPRTSQVVLQPAT
ncbi:hypothetical protein [Cellulomonas aerilata]|uniref:Uncharacterized protein n=1 Tax=Cellulomonas aerilata TaxID=515326 RepID=A0A512D9D1_9CELL|nr:hypothetical protein [Cellulomonas aerilata]GEO33094.1 hypothetical protein CAE01nite_08190 [Cellulomonas aerilata]